MAELRTHQKEIESLATQVITGAFPDNQIVLDCTPGGGKTGSGILLAHRLLDAGTTARVLWLVPRLSLAEQVADAFNREFLCRADRQLTVVSGQDQLFPPCLPGTPQIAGHVTTYQSVAARGNWRRFHDALTTCPVLLVLDEVQFLNEEGHEERRGWYEHVREVYRAARFRLVMSGTLWRTDGKRIPFVEYERRADGLFYPRCHISYPLRDAVREQAVLPTEWRNTSGVVRYSYNGTPHEHDLMNDGEDEEARKVRTFLSADNAVHGLLDSMVEHWREWRRRTYQSRMLVIADDTQQARKWRHYLQSKHDVPCTLATCKEESAGRKLRHFRERSQGQCLLTVQMAYVGFDCPDLTHLCYLSATRAPSWMLQSFARVSRFDGRAPVDYAHQHAFVFAPDDERMRRFCAWVRHHVEVGMAERCGRGPRQPQGDGPAIVMPDDFDPHGATLGPSAIESIEPTVGRIPPDVAGRLDAFVGTCPAAAGLSRSQLYEILRAGAGITLSPEQGNGGVTG